MHVYLLLFKIYKLFFIESKESYEKLYKKHYKRIVKKIELDEKQITKAVKALQKYFEVKEKKESLKLLKDDAGFIIVNILLSEVPMKFSPRPVQIPIPHPIYGPKYNSNAWLIKTDPEREFLDKIEDLNLPWLSKWISFNTLFKEFARYKDKTSLLNEFHLFFADARIYKMLAKPLGKYFFANKKYPFPVRLSDLQGADLEQTLNGLMDHTYFHIRNGPNYSFRVARTFDECERKQLKI